MKIPRNEYPRPEFCRKSDSWMTLNGEWDFQSAPSGEGKAGCPPKESYGEKIIVPFAPEAEFSGIGRTDFMGYVSYRRTFSHKGGAGGRVLLHVGSADYKSRVYINGEFAGCHTGGYTPAVYDITRLVKDGENTVNISVWDDTRSPLQPSGKQAGSVAPRGCFYTRVTGIWQSVWLEFVPEAYIRSFQCEPDVKNGAVHFTAKTCGDGVLKCEISFGGESVTEVSAVTCGGQARFSAKIPDARLWDIGQGNLYDVHLVFGSDSADTYFGMRSIETDGRRVLLNSRPVFMRLVLDQGYYPGGIYTAPDAADFRCDIELSQSAGFNGARMHMKVFEPRYLYEADRLGYLLWGEYPNWGLDISRPEALDAILPEWTEELSRDACHPSVIGWCPLNEAFPAENVRLVQTLYDVTKKLDPMRLYIDVSGYIHCGETDIYDVHDYEQDPEVLRAHYAGLTVDGQEVYANPFDKNGVYDGKMPYFVSEFGGAFFDADAHREACGQESGGAWGYGRPPKSTAEYEARFAALCGVLLDNPSVCGFCFTQFTDVMQEMNGIFTFDRRAKFDTKSLSCALTRKAAIE